jgi:hypothetical protein
VRRLARWWLAAVLAAAVVPLPLGFFVRDPAPPAAAGAPQGLVGATLHSRWLDPRAPVPQERVAALVREAGLQVLPFGVPVGDAEARASAPAAVDAWLARVAPLPTIPSINTFALPRAQQTREGLRAFFAPLAAVLARHPDVLVVAGANEPLTRGKGWASPADAEARLRLDSEAWHDVSPLPFCHKFTNPRVDTPGTDWAMLDRLWGETEDAICYDWYAPSGDAPSTMDHLRDLGARLGKPVHVLEAAIPGGDPGLLRQLAQRADTFSVYQLLATSGGEDERLAAWVWDGSALREQGPGAMLRVALGAPAASARG